MFVESIFAKRRIFMCALNRRIDLCRFNFREFADARKLDTCENNYNNFTCNLPYHKYHTNNYRIAPNICGQ